MYRRVCMRSRREKLMRVAHPLTGIIVVAAALCVLEIALRVFHVREYVFPKPSDILGAARSTAAAIPRACGITLLEALAGLIAAFVVATILGITSALLPRGVSRPLTASAIVFQSTPILALAPLLSMWFG